MFGIPEVTILKFDYLNATEVEQIKRNLNLLYSTAAGTCPGDRNFGLDQSFESFPINIAKNLFALEVIEKTELYESRMEVLNITYEQAEDGNLTPKIMVSQRDTDEDEQEI